MANESSSPPSRHALSTSAPKPVINRYHRGASQSAPSHGTVLGKVVTSPLRPESTFIGRGQKMRREMTAVGIGREPTYYIQVNMMDRRSKSWMGDRKLTSSFSSFFASDEGRNRSTVFPPLARDPNKGDPAKKQQQQQELWSNYQGPQSEVNESHWQLSPRRVSHMTDRRIVVHLRKKLSRRIERRLEHLLDGHVYAEESQIDYHRPRLNGKDDPDENNIYNKYTEHGDIRKKSYTLAQNGPLLPTIEQNGTSAASVDSAKVHDHPNHQQNGDPDLRLDLGEEGQGQTAGQVLDSEGTTQRKSLTPTLPDEKAENGEEVAEEDADEEVRRIENESASKSPELVVSPVATPMVFRPETGVIKGLTWEERAQAILSGKLNVKLETDDRVVALYFHSAGVDTEAERTYLIQKALPMLKVACMQKSLDLRVLDLHWGCRDLVADNHSDLDYRLKVISDCKSSKIGLNFMTFLSHKYCEPDIPTTISKLDFECILNAVKADARTQEEQKAREEAEKALQNSEEDQQSESSSAESGADEKRQTEGRRYREGLVTSVASARTYETPDFGLLEMWYKLDKNAVPPVYKLQRISSQYKDILVKDVNRRVSARTQWSSTSRRIHKMLTYFTEKLLSGSELDRVLKTSFTEIELNHGLLQHTSNPNQQGFWFKRELENIQTTDSAARDYLDMHPVNPTTDRQLTQAMVQLRDEELGRQLAEYNTRRTVVPWSRFGVSPLNVRSHLTHVERLGKDVVDVVSRRIDDSLKEQTSNQPSPLLIEVSTHVTFCRQRAHGFHGRKDPLSALKRYVRSAGTTGSSVAPCIVHGKAGCGTTSLMARAAKDTHKWLKGTSSCCIVRVIGVTTNSTNIRTLLQDVCLQLAHIAHIDAKAVPKDYKGLFNYMSFLFMQVPEDTTLVIILDSLHMLTDENDPKKLQWLPKELPSNVRLILSTKSDDDSFKHLKRAFFKTHPHQFIEVGDLAVHDASMILDHWYENSDRCVTEQQLKAMLTAFKQNPYPLYLKVMYNESLTWPSTLNDPKIGQSVKTIATMIFGRMERDLGEPLVRRALGYITASKSGVGENEMEDLLSLDDAVMDDITSHSALPIRRIPTMHWVRIQRELGDYLKETHADKTTVVSWTYSQFKEAAEERYLDARDKAPSYHKAMAEYFSNTWYEVPKPYGHANKSAERFVMPQFLTSESSAAEDQESVSVVYNHRRLNELPWHLLKSVQLDLFKTQCLMNYDFLLAKLSAMSLRSVLDDIQVALISEPNDLDLKMLSDTLHLSGKVLLEDASQLAGQLVGRLRGIILKDKPVAPGDPVKYKFLHGLVGTARKPSKPMLIPSITCLTPPGGILFDLLSGHSDPITAVTLSTDGQKAVTTAKDNTMKVWELRTGRVMKTIMDVGEDVHFVRFASGNMTIVTSESNCIRVWNLRNGECTKVIQTLDIASITVANEGQYLVGFFHGANKMNVWDLKGGKVTETKEVFLQPPENHAIHKDNSIICSINSIGPLVLHAFKSAHVATVRNAKTGGEVHTLKCEETGSIKALACSRDYFICAARYQYMKLHEIYQLELFDSRNGKFVRSVRGCIQDNITDMFVNHIGSHALSVCTSESSNSSSIAVWNIETEDHKHLAKHGGVTPFGACGDLRYCLTASKDENTLRIWNLSGKINQPTPKEKTPEGIEMITPMVDHRHYVVAQSVNHGPLAVWNIVKEKCIGKAVRIERGLTEASDTMIIHNTKAIILAEKGYSSVHAGGPPVYSTVLIYDLLKKTYVNKVKGCFIVPCLAHEYVMVDDDHLMGLSENRNHFVVWNIMSGQIAYRIKSKFREMDRKKMDRTESRRQSPWKGTRGTTAKMTPWERRSETQSARLRRHQQEQEEEELQQEVLRKEKDNGIDKFLISKDHKTLAASYYAHHICIFDIPTQTHIQTLENLSSMLLLHVAALTTDGGHLVHANYDDASKTSYLTLWDCKSGSVRRRLRNERNVAAISINDSASRIVFGKTNQELRIWEPLRHNILRKIKGYSSLDFGVNSQIHMIEDGTKAIVYAGDISLWDLDNGTVLTVFTPDMKIQCLTVCMEGQMIVFGLRDTFEVVTLRLRVKDGPELDRSGKYLFGESSTSEEDDDEGEEVEEEDDY